MRYPPRQVDAGTIRRATQRARRWLEDFLEAAREFASDARQAERQQAQLCLTCFYVHSPRIGGQAVTVQPCGLCNQDQTYGSTSTNALCLPCARGAQLCARCGADIELRASREIKASELRHG